MNLKNLHLAYNFEVKNDIIIFDVRTDHSIVDLKNTRRITILLTV